MIVEDLILKFIVVYRSILKNHLRVILLHTFIQQLNVFWKMIDLGSKVNGSEPILTQEFDSK